MVTFLLSKSSLKSIVKLKYGHKIKLRGKRKKAFKQRSEKLTQKEETA